MMGVGAAARQQTNGTAKRIRKSGEAHPDLAVMTTVTCESCGASFAIGHRLAFQNAALAVRQAAWLADRLVWDHIQENKHRGSIFLPACDQMK